MPDKRLFQRLRDRLPSRDRRESRGQRPIDVRHKDQPIGGHVQPPAEKYVAASAQCAPPNLVVSKPSLWALAYERLRQENPDLIERLNYLEIGITDAGYACIGRTAQKAIEEINQAEDQNKPSKIGRTVQKYSQNTIKIIIASRGFIASAASMNPYAALAWSGVSLLLPVS